jgi:pyridoxine/pyridoxamine 5'-phosphate oxidase
VTVATIGQFPKSRVVLLKVYRRRIYFLHNYNSEKARRLKRTLKYVFLFLHSMERQVIIKGIAKEPQKSFLIIILIQDQKEVS